MIVEKLCDKSAVLKKMLARYHQVRAIVRKGAQEENVSQVRFFIKKLHTKLCNTNALYATLVNLPNLRADYIKNVEKTETYKAYRKFYEMMNKGDCKEALKYLAPYAKKYPENTEVSNLIFISYHDINEKNPSQENVPQKSYSLNNIKFIDNNFVPFGHTALLDMFYKAKQLKIMPEYDIRMNAHTPYMNKSLADKFSQYFPYDYNLEKTFTEDFIRNNSLLSLAYQDESFYVAQEAWDKQGREPTLSFTESEIAQGESQLKKLGKPEGAWFVTVHMRHTSESNHIRNTDMNTYLPAIRMITDRGGHVLRIGDASAPALPPMDKVIDLAHLAEKDHFLQLYACGACTFFLGSNSGPIAVSWCFGRPSVYTNSFVTLQLWTTNILAIPLLLVNKVTGEPISVQDMQKDKTICVANIPYLQKKGYNYRFNTAADICAAVTEMFDRIEDKIISDAEYTSLQQKWAQIPMRLVPGCTKPSRAKVSWEFAKKYSYILD